ncbi:heavy-metal-associated domain-containing protein [Thermodesulfobacteriota bacterium]
MKKFKKITTVLSGLLLSVIIAAHADSATVKRSNFIVGNLSCTSCLANIEAELKTVTGALGMNADLRSGRVTIDHLSSLDPDQIATIITRLGYPAAMEWTATVPEQYTNTFAERSRYGSGCSSGGCGTSAGAGSGPTTWKAPPATGALNRTTLQVSNLSCSSCLANIAERLRNIPETYGMKGYLSRGIVIVDHADASVNKKIASAISGLGYPARVLSTNEIPAQKAFTAAPAGGSRQANAGSGCNSKGPCNATSASWQKLYKRYFTQTSTK